MGTDIGRYRRDDDGPDPSMTGRRAQLAALYRGHHRQVLAYALRRTLNRADADDIVSETFTIAWRRLDMVPAGSGALPWLYAVAHRVLANHRRRADTRARLGRDLAAETMMDTAPPDGGDHDIGAALQRLSPDDQELLRLAVWEELRHQDIATVLGITENAVSIRLYKARNKLRTILTDAKGEGPE